MTNPTHQVTVVVTSHEDSPEVHMEVKWEPAIGGQEIEDQGYIPAAYLFVQNCLLAAEMATEGLMDVEQEDLDPARTLN